jgi:hypothetical protein
MQSITNLKVGVLRTLPETLKNSKKNFWRVRTAFCSSSHSQNFESWELRLSRARNPKWISDCDKLDLKVGVLNPDASSRLPIKKILLNFELAFVSQMRENKTLIRFEPADAGKQNQLVLSPHLFHKCR